MALDCMMKWLIFLVLLSVSFADSSRSVDLVKNRYYCGAELIYTFEEVCSKSFEDDWEHSIYKDLKKKCCVEQCNLKTIKMYCHKVKNE